MILIVQLILLWSSTPFRSALFQHSLSRDIALGHKLLERREYIKPSVQDGLHDRNCLLFHSRKRYTLNEILRLGTSLAKLQNTLQLTPSFNLLLLLSRSRHNLHNIFI